MARTKTLSELFDEITGVMEYPGTSIDLLRSIRNRGAILKRRKKLIQRLNKRISAYRHQRLKHAS